MILILSTLSVAPALAGDLHLERTVADILPSGDTTLHHVVILTEEQSIEGAVTRGALVDVTLAPGDEQGTAWIDGWPYELVVGDNDLGDLVIRTRTAGTAERLGGELLWVLLEDGSSGYVRLRDIAILAESLDGERAYIERFSLTDDVFATIDTQSLLRSNVEGALMRGLPRSLNSSPSEDTPPLSPKDGAIDPDPLADPPASACGEHELLSCPDLSRINGAAPPSDDIDDPSYAWSRVVAELAGDIDVGCDDRGCPDSDETWEEVCDSLEPEFHNMFCGMIESLEKGAPGDPRVSGGWENCVHLEASMKLACTALPTGPKQVCRAVATAAGKTCRDGVVALETKIENTDAQICTDKGGVWCVEGVCLPAGNTCAVPKE